ncbi:energy-coupling factor ABC transporter permease [Kutzneria albida]|uniref:Putative membrane protein n=1 Tax=Kutzneria albida DSM 43870 TaxID=1449976 RepID=W5W1U3_9PSEU|nr:energy-coupling factor ABC transporter permease [Kutzneria albida]AHH94827.1 putative membrane protein [Kutzneria albida DSM 43870]
MHIPDGFVNAPVSVAGAVVAVGGLAVCSGRLGSSIRDRDIPLAGLAAAFFLVLEAPIFPIGVGTGGHLLGGTLAVALLGPWLGPVVISVVLVVQALFAGDGGVTALGVNAVNLALLPALIGYPLILGLRKLLPRTKVAVVAGCAVSAVIAVIAASVLYSLEYAVGGAAGVPAATVAISTIGTYSIIALFEGLVTGLVVAALLRLRPDLVRVGRHLTAKAQT